MQYTKQYPSVYYYIPAALLNDNTIKKGTGQILLCPIPGIHNDMKLYLGPVVVPALITVDTELALTVTVEADVFVPAVTTPSAGAALAAEIVEDDPDPGAADTETAELLDDPAGETVTLSLPGADEVTAAELFPVLLVVVVVTVVVVVVVPFPTVSVVLELMVPEVPPGVVTALLPVVPEVACVTVTPFTELVHTPSLLNLYSLPSMVAVLPFIILPSLR